MFASSLWQASCLSFQRLLMAFVQNYPRSTYHRLCQPGQDVGCRGNASCPLYLESPHCADSKTPHFDVQRPTAFRLGAP
ncbi:uncharacterized protein F5Z01DRAFT_653049 [Emericellopsis atlantica]|uniref:Uncharacterized protein n=1 Tax=Emericellopsis atlantica TaxID=2614577 RepID=A0A9P7ZNS1_9HYPO|nr:uncharacterized protein F5Z01DRAFT_653049 [Emericellopsis atlantica]KAG9255415.1 hypothetical protein F5Z01DRAFT_653049 [Emericellopsis atlantica]